MNTDSQPSSHEPDAADPSEQADHAFFQQAMRHVKPLARTQRVEPSQTPPSNWTPRRSPPPSTCSDGSVARQHQINCDRLIELSAVEPQASLSYFQPHLNRRTCRQLKQGKLAIENRLDLHGLLIEAAVDTCWQFIESCRRQQQRHVLIITGKGRAHQHPTIKTAINHCLRQWPTVLAFCSSQAKDGHTGSLYVLLKQAG